MGEMNGKTTSDQKSAPAGQALTSYENLREHARIAVQSHGANNYAELTFADGQTGRVQLVNYSYTGMLATSDEEYPVEAGDKIPQIRLHLGFNRPTVFEGVVVRATGTDDGWRYAVRFVVTSQRVNQEARAESRSKDDYFRARMHWLQQLMSLPNHRDLNDPGEVEAVQAQVMDVFATSLAQLSDDEQWWFFELYDELKRHEPDYPMSLLDEFIEMCE